jgi:Tol biopolymer transport system component
VVSPDGSRFAVTGTVAGERALYWRSADEESFRVVPGTSGALGATFSPDGDWIAYGAVAGALFKVSLSGGAPVLLVPAGRVSQLVYFPHWGDDGTIVFNNPSGSFRVPDTGGEPVPLSTPEPIIHPHLLPGGWAVLGNPVAGGVVLRDLVADTTRELSPIGLTPKYVETGHILYLDGSGGLWALPFDAVNGEVLGDAVPILEGVSVPSQGPYRYPRYSVSRNGTLVYGAGSGIGGAGSQQRLLVVGLEGNEEPIPLDPREFGGVRWSPDGESVVYHGSEPGGAAGAAGVADIFTYNVALRTAPRRLTFEGINRVPVWSPDGTRVAFGSIRGATEGFDLFVKTVNDDSPPQMIVTLPGNQFPTQWPSDDVVLFENGGPSDLWMVDLSSDPAVARPYLESEADLDDLMVSSVGDLAVYASNESGEDEVYVRSFPEARQPEIISQGGGTFPSWSPDGNTIYYWTLGPRTAIKSLIAARIERGPPFVVISRDTVITGIYLNFDSDLHTDGDRLVVPQDVGVVGATAGEALAPDRSLVVTNWFEELRQRLGN